MKSPNPALKPTRILRAAYFRSLVLCLLARISCLGSKKETYVHKASRNSSAPDIRWIHLRILWRLSPETSL